MSMITQVYSHKLRKKVYKLDIRINKKRVRRLFHTRSDAETVAYKLRHDSTLRRYGIRSISGSPELEDLIRRRCAVIANKNERTRAARVLKYLLALLPRGVQVSQVSAPDLQLYVERRIADGLQPQSVNRELNIIGATLHAASMFYVELEQWVAPRIPRPKQRKRRRERYIKDEEKEAILDWLKAPQRDGEDPQAVPARIRIGLMFEWAFLTAMRHGEINKLQWSDIQWRNQTVRVVDTKRDKYRYIPITPTMKAILDERKDAKSKYVFTRSGNAPPNFYEILNRVCNAVSVPYGPNVKNGLIFHDARHTATTNLLRAGIDMSTIQSITGHSDQTMVLYYSHPSGETRSRAAEALERTAGRKTA